MKIQFTEIAGAAGSTELTLRANTPNDAARLFKIYEFLRDYSGVVKMTTTGTSGTLNADFTL